MLARNVFIIQHSDNIFPFAILLEYFTEYVQFESYYIKINVANKKAMLWSIWKKTTHYTLARQRRTTKEQKNARQNPWEETNSSFLYILLIGLVGLYKHTGFAGDIKCRCCSTNIIPNEGWEQQKIKKKCGKYLTRNKSDRMTEKK